MAKQVDIKAAKERKQKKIAAVGGVLLVIVLFIQVPRTLKMMNGEAEPAAAAPGTPAAPTPAPGAPAPVPAAPVPQPEVVTAALVSFSRFESKDPFVQQVKENGGGASEVPPDSSVDVGGGEGVIAEPDGESEPPEPAAFTRAEIEVNGVAELLGADSAFPATNPMFLLVSISKKSVGIKVADGGTFASGDPTLTLTLGKPVTLVNTADGTRFVLELKGVS